MSATLTETVQCLHHSDEGTSSCSCADDNQAFSYGYEGGGISEIEEESSSQFEGRQQQLHEAMAAIKEEYEEEDSVYVAVGKSETSMEALSWALKNLVAPSTIVYLIHVFPEIKFIPSPLFGDVVHNVVSFGFLLFALLLCLMVYGCVQAGQSQYRGRPTLGMGMIPKDQVSQEQVESYMAQERGKRGELLQKFLQSCSASKVKGDTILIESDMVAKAILDLIPILNITKLVVGINKSNMRKLRSRKGNGIVDQILQNAPESCNLSIICEGKEVNEETLGSSSPLVPSPRANAKQNSTSPKEEQQNDSISCICFKAKFR